MTMFESLIAVTKQCYREPRAAARNLLDLGVPKESLVPGLGFVVAISVIIRTVLETSMGIDEQGSILANAVMVAVAIAVHAACIWKIGEMMGGVGKFSDALLIDIFLQIALLPVLLVFVILFASGSGILLLASFVVLAFAIWVNLCFVDVLHGFGSMMKAFGLILFAAFVSMILAGILTLPLFLATSGGVS